MRDRDYLLAPNFVTVSFGLEPVFSAIVSLESLVDVDQYFGMGEWAEKTARILPPDLMRTHRLVYGPLHIVFYDIIPSQPWPSFPAFLDTLAALDPVDLRDRMVAKFRDVPAEWSDPGVTPPPPPAAERLLADLPTYLDWLKVVWPDCSPDPDLDPEAHALLNDPPALQELMISHLRMMWHGVLETEWKRNLPMLQESVAAFQQMDYSGLTVYEAIRAVTGRDIRGHWQRKLQLTEHLIFIPSAHAGPYLTKFAEGTTLRVVFGARLPKGYQYGSSALSRSELLVRLNALVDDTRLRILEVLAQEDELCAQDIITRLGVSQSSVSRHLSQLSATGYITERRRDVSKCYSLNPDRVEETLKAVARFLKKKVSTPTP